jgi:hypothetical protein
LSSLKPAELTGQSVEKTITFNELMRDPEPHPLKINGVIYDNGISARLQADWHTRATTANPDHLKTITYNLNGQLSSLTGLIGVDDRSSTKVIASVRFLADGKEIGSFANLKACNSPIPIALDVKGIHTLTISFEMDNIENGINLDFVNAYLSK